MKSFICALFLLICESAASMSQVESTQSGREAKLFDTYDSLLVEKVTNDLLVNHKLYTDSPNKYWQFLNETFVDNWDFDATTRALIGNKIFNDLSYLQFKKLARTVEVTLIRYAFESLSFYSEQRLNVIDIALNEQQTLAWLKINMESPSFPDIHLDLMLKRKGDVQWKGIDFRFKGITYVNMKKNSFRQDFEELKFQGLLNKLDNKNKVFFRDLCHSNANYIDPKEPPCLQNYDSK